jgi:hypothetical protein
MVSPMHTPTSSEDDASSTTPLQKRKNTWMSIFHKPEGVLLQNHIIRRGGITKVRKIHAMCDESHISHEYILKEGFDKEAWKHFKKMLSEYRIGEISGTIEWNDGTISVKGNNPYNRWVRELE